jgi:hypothetical protein
MNRKKIKISLEDDDGGKYDLALEGNISKTKIIKFIEVLDLLEIKGKDNLGEINRSNEKENLSSIGSKIWNIIEQKFPHSTFTTSDILEIYEDEYQESIVLSVISTYLSRYSDRKKLSRNRKGREWVYKIIRNPSVLEEMHRSPVYSPPHHLSSEVPPTDMN